jgi:hypothetical protein
MKSKDTEFIQSYSGAHPFRPQCLVAVWERDGGLLALDLGLATPVEELVALIDRGHCPSCQGKLPTEHPAAGSRATECRCIPVCPTCGGLEALGVDPVTLWPRDRRSVLRTHRRVFGRSPSRWRVWLRRRMAATRPTPTPRPNGVPPKPTGGWVAFGYDDEPDRREREGRTP